MCEIKFLFITFFLYSQMVDLRPIKRYVSVYQAIIQNLGNHLGQVSVLSSRFMWILEVLWNIMDRDSCISISRSYIDYLILKSFNISILSFLIKVIVNQTHPKWKHYKCKVHTDVFIVCDFAITVKQN